MILNTDIKQARMFVNNNLELLKRTLPFVFILIWLFIKTFLKGTIGLILSQICKLCCKKDTVKTNEISIESKRLEDSLCNIELDKMEQKIKTYNPRENRKYGVCIEA